MTKQYPCALLFMTLALAAFQAVPASGQYVYITSSTRCVPNSPCGTIQTDFYNPATGAGTALNSFLSTPSNALVFEPAGRFAYSPGVVLSVSPATGALTALSVPSFATGTFGLVMHPSGKFIFGIGANLIYAYSLDPVTGGLSPVAGSPWSTTVGNGIPAVDPLGRFVYLPSGGGVDVFAVNTSTGALTKVPGSPFATTQSIVWSVTPDASGKFIYTVGSTSNPVTAVTTYALEGFNVNTAGAFTTIPGSPFFTSNVMGKPVLSRNGKFLYAGALSGAATAYSIYGFSLNAVSGTLTLSGTPVQLSPLASNQLWMDLAGTFLFTTVQMSNTCTGPCPVLQAYAVDANAGSLTATANTIPITGGQFFGLASVVFYQAPAISLIQSISSSGTSVGTMAIAFPSANTTGNTIVAFVRMSTMNQTVSVTDSQGNVYSRAVSQTQSTDGHQTAIYYAKNVAAGINTVTAQFSAANAHPFLAIYEYAGLSATAPLDKVAAAQGNNSATASSGATAVTASANQLIFAGAGLPNAWPGTVTVGAGYTLLRQDLSGTSRAVNQSQTASAAGSFNPAFTLSAPTNWSAVTATFAAATSAPVSIANTTLPSGLVNNVYSGFVSAMGGTVPYTFSVTSGVLPAGLTLNSTAGTITGTPTGANGTLTTLNGAAAVSYTFTVQVRDAQGQTAARNFTAAFGSAMQWLGGYRNAGSSVASLAATFPNGNQGGDLLVVFVRMSTANQTVKVTDSYGNTYTDAVSQVQNADGHQVHIFYAKNVTASTSAANVVTATFSGVNAHPFLAVDEYAGFSSTAPLDLSAAAQGSGTTASTPATGTLASPFELVYVGSGYPNAWPGTVTAENAFSFHLQAQDTGNERAATEGTYSDTYGPYTGTFGLSQTANWSAIVATFR